LPATAFDSSVWKNFSSENGLGKTRSAYHVRSTTPMYGRFRCFSAKSSP
jgi:hypothetical protein